MAASVTLLTERLRIEPIRTGYADLVFDNFSDERLWKLFPELRPKSVEELRALFRMHETSARDPETGDQSIGTVQAFTTLAGDSYIGFLLYHNYQGQGYAREACASVIAYIREHRGVKRVNLYLDPQNTSSIKLADSLGFARIAENKAVERRYGLFGDEVVYELRLD
ncbi:MAG: hypothetical protein NVSMB31_05220 [Vulcanimicrobiaceae bacterium]